VLGQFAIQALAFAGGILVIRLLTPAEYALYALANAALGTMTALADSGVSAGVTAQGGRVWNQPQKLAIVLRTGLLLRRRFALISLAIAIPWTLYILRTHGAAWLTALALIGATMPSFYAAITGSLLAVPLQLHQRIWDLQQTQLLGNLVRLPLLIGGLAIAPFAWSAVAANAIGQILQNLRLRRLQSELTQQAAGEDPAVRAELMRTVWRLLPGTAYHAFFGQITLWLVSLIGSTATVAKLSALTRLTMVLSVVHAAFGTLVVPRFATLTSSRPQLTTRFLQIQALVIAIGVFVTGIVWLFPSQALRILGPRYADMDYEIILATAGASISLAAGIVYALNAARGRIPPGHLYPVTGMATTIVLAFLIDLRTLSGAMIFSMCSALSALIVGNLVFFRILESPQAHRP
jgi:O-antigen/teichoic acid export membrane protein